VRARVATPFPWLSKVLRIPAQNSRSSGYRRPALQVAVRRPIEHPPKSVKAGAVTRTIPGFLGTVPVDDASEMRADGRTRMHAARGAAVDGDLGQAATQYGALAWSDLFHGGHVATGEPVAALSGDVEVFAHEFASGPQSLTRRVVER